MLVPIVTGLLFVVLYVVRLCSCRPEAWQGTSLASCPQSESHKVSDSGYIGSISDLQGTLLYIFPISTISSNTTITLWSFKIIPVLPFTIGSETLSQQIILVSELILVWNVCLLSVNVDSDVKNPQSSIFTVVMNLYSTGSWVIYNYEFRYFQWIYWQQVRITLPDGWIARRSITYSLLHSKTVIAGPSRVKSAIFIFCGKGIPNTPGLVRLISPVNCFQIGFASAHKVN